MPRPFLTAAWRNLILANYRVPEALLRPHLPPGVELDTWDGSAWASLVGFQFHDTRVFGVSWPGYRHFPEWNLRFYVRHRGERGVCFVREFVPKWFVASVARVLYNEPYRVARMTGRAEDGGCVLAAEYTVDWGGRTHRLSAVGDQPPVRPEPDSAEHWFKEQKWGFGVTRRGRLLRYEVEHPEWEVYPIRSFTADVDWGVLYGPRWAAMAKGPPANVMLVAGSAVKVFPYGTR